MTEKYDGQDPVQTLIHRARTDVDTDVLRDVSAALARDVAAAVTPQRRPRRIIAVSLAALVVAVPTSAAAYAWTTHTGLFGDSSRFTEDVDNSEWLDLCAPDFPQVARTLVPRTLPLPDGLTVEMVSDALWSNPSPDCADSRVRMQATGISARYQGYAWCSWVNDYVDDRDRASRDEAAQSLHVLANSHLTHLTDGDGRQVPIMNEIADAAAAGDVARVRDELRVNCVDFGFRP